MAGKYTFLAGRAVLCIFYVSAVLIVKTRSMATPILHLRTPISGESNPSENAYSCLLVVRGRRDVRR